MPKYGMLLAMKEGSARRQWLTDEANRIMLLRFDRDPTRSFLIVQDVVTGKFLGWDGEEGKLMMVDEAVTTRNLLSIKGDLSHFYMLGSAEQGGTNSFVWSLKQIRYRPYVDARSF